MPIRRTFIIALLLVSSYAKSQIATTYGEIKDERDGKTYQTLQVGNTLWLAENLKYESEGSEHHEKSVDGYDLDGYYYPFVEIDEVCPEGFRIPTANDWKEYFQLVYDSENLANSTEEFSGKDKDDNEFIGRNILDAKLNPFEDPNPLNLKAHGHTQGGKVVGIGSMNFWIKYKDSTDPKYHLHMMSDGYNIHSHKHHIIDRKRRQRKFSVRCVKN